MAEGEREEGDEAALRVDNKGIQPAGVREAAVFLAGVVAGGGQRSEEDGGVLPCGLVRCLPQVRQPKALPLPKVQELLCGSERDAAPVGKG